MYMALYQPCVKIFGRTCICLLLRVFARRWLSSGVCSLCQRLCCSKMDKRSMVVCLIICTLSVSAYVKSHYTLCLKNRTPETFYYNFAKIALHTTCIWCKYITILQDIDIHSIITIALKLKCTMQLLHFTWLHLDFFIIKNCELNVQRGGVVAMMWHLQSKSVCGFDSWPTGRCHVTTMSTSSTPCLSSLHATGKIWLLHWPCVAD